jgi:hypothetical protein
VHARLEARKPGEASLADCCCSGTRTAPERTQRACAAKPIAARGGLALIVCNGGGKFGYRHVKRMPRWRARRDSRISSVFAMSGSAERWSRSSVRVSETVGFSHYEFSQLTKLVGLGRPIF